MKRVPRPQYWNICPYFRVRADFGHRQVEGSSPVTGICEAANRKEKVQCNYRCMVAVPNVVKEASK